MRAIIMREATRPGGYEQAAEYVHKYEKNLTQSSLRDDWVPPREIRQFDADLRTVYAAAFLATDLSYFEYSAEKHWLDNNYRPKRYSSEKEEEEAQAKANEIRARRHIDIPHAAAAKEAMRELSLHAEYCMNALRYAYMRNHHLPVPPQLAISDGASCYDKPEEMIKAIQMARQKCEKTALQFEELPRALEIQDRTLFAHSNFPPSMLRNYYEEKLVPGVVTTLERMKEALTAMEKDVEANGLAHPDPVDTVRELPKRTQARADGAPIEASDTTVSNVVHIDFKQHGGNARK